MHSTEICRMSALEMAEAVRSRKLSPVETTDAVLRQIEALNPAVNAFCTVAADHAIRQARKAENAVIKGDKLGPLHGVPVSIKDLIYTKGIRTTGASPIYEDLVPGASDIVVERLEAAGAIVVGKTNSSEFGWAAITDNRLFGPTRNPWNPQLTPGGSSGGAAAAVALFMGPIAIGSDGGGSIRIPSSFCGVFGLKPSFGRVPRGPGFGGWETLSHTGPITRTVEDAALVMDIIAGRDERDWYSQPYDGPSFFRSLDADLSGLKVAWSADLGFSPVDPLVAAMARASAKAFEKMGATVRQADLKLHSPEHAFSTCVGARLAAVLEDKMPEWGGRIDPVLARFVELSRTKSSRDFLEASWKLLRIWDDIYPVFDEFDLLLTPTVTVLPFELGRYGPAQIAGSKVSPLAWMSLSYPFNATGQPAATVPCGWTPEGLPVGLQIIGRRFDDLTVLKAAYAFEKAAPWADRVPPLIR